MFEENGPLDEIHKIRRQHYRERKHMSAKEKVAVIHKSAEEFMKKHGLKLRIRKVA